MKKCILCNREQAFRAIENSKGRFFGVTYDRISGREDNFVGQFKHFHTKRREVDKIYGYTTVSVVKKQRKARVNNRGLKEVRINHLIYKVK